MLFFFLLLLTLIMSGGRGVVGRPRKRPTLESAIYQRQDLALNSLWVPLAAAAEDLHWVRAHPSRSFAPRWDAHYDGRGALFMSEHTRMIASPEDGLCAGFPRCWTAVVKARYAELTAEQLDPVALLVLRLMCEMPVQIFDASMCYMAARLVLDAQCCVDQAMRRCYFWMEHVLAMRISAPAYDLGKMALWMWSTRYMEPTGRWALAIYHELGLPYMSDSYHTLAHTAIPAQVWPRTADRVYRTTLEEDGDGELRYVLNQQHGNNSSCCVYIETAMVYYCILRCLHEAKEFCTFGALAKLSRAWNYCATSVLFNHANRHSATHYDMLMDARATAYGRHGTRLHQRRFIETAVSAQVCVRRLQEMHQRNK